MEKNEFQRYYICGNTLRHLVRNVWIILIKITGKNDN